MSNENNVSLLSRKSIEDSLISLYNDLYDDIKFYLVTSDYCDKLEQDTFDSLKEFFYEKTLRSKYNGLEDESIKMIRSNLLYNQYSYERFLLAYKDYKFKILDLFNYKIYQKPAEGNEKIDQENLKKYGEYDSYPDYNNEYNYKRLNDTISIKYYETINSLKNNLKEIDIDFDSDTYDYEDNKFQLINNKLYYKGNKINNVYKFNVDNTDIKELIIDLTNKTNSLLNNDYSYPINNTKIMDYSNEIIINTLDDYGISYPDITIYKNIIKNIPGLNKTVYLNGLNKSTMLYFDSFDNGKVVEHKSDTVDMFKVNELEFDNDKILFNNKPIENTWEYIDEVVSKDSNKIVHLDTNQNEKLYFYEAISEDNDEINISDMDLIPSIGNNITNIDTGSLSIIIFNKESPIKQDSSYIYQVSEGSITNFSIENNILNVLNSTIVQFYKDTREIYFKPTSNLKYSDTIIQQLIINNDKINEINLLKEGLPTINSFKCNDNHFIYINDSYTKEIHQYKIPNPNYIELQEFYIDKQSDNKYDLHLKFSDYDTMNNLIDLDWNLASLYEPFVMYYNPDIKLQNDLLYVTYNNNIKTQFLLADLYDYYIELEGKTLKACFRDQYNNELKQISGDLINIDNPITSTRIKYEDNALVLEKDDGSTIRQLLNINQITNKESKSYEYTIKSESENGSFNTIIENGQETDHVIRLDKQNNIYIKNITRDFENEKFLIEYTDNTSIEYKDLIGRNFLKDLYKSNFYDYYDGTVVKNSIINNELTTQRFDLHKYEDVLGKISVTTKNGLYTFKSGNKYLGDIDFSNLDYSINYEKYNTIYYDVYSDLTTNKLIDNRLLICKDLNPEALVQKITINGIEKSYTLNIGYGFAIAYDKYTIEETDSIGSHQILDLKNTSYVNIENDAKILKFNGLNIDLPVLNTKTEFDNLITNSELLGYTDTNPYLWEPDNANKIIDLFDIDELDIKRIYKLTIHVNKDLVTSLANTEDNENKFSIRITHLSKDNTEVGSEDLTYSNGLIDVDDFHGYIFNVSPKQEKLKVSFTLYSTRNVTNVDIWGFSFEQTNKLKLSSGIYVAL